MVQFTMEQLITMTPLDNSHHWLMVSLHLTPDCLSPPSLNRSLIFAISDNLTLGSVPPVVVYSYLCLCLSSIQFFIWPVFFMNSHTRLVWCCFLCPLPRLASEAKRKLVENILFNNIQGAGDNKSQEKNGSQTISLTRLSTKRRGRPRTESETDGSQEGSKTRLAGYLSPSRGGMPRNASAPHFVLANRNMSSVFTPIARSENNFFWRSFITF